MGRSRRGVRLGCRPLAGSLQWCGVCLSTVRYASTMASRTPRVPSMMYWRFGSRIFHTGHPGLEGLGDQRGVDSHHSRDGGLGDHVDVGQQLLGEIVSERQHSDLDTAEQPQDTGPCCRIGFRNGKCGSVHTGQGSGHGQGSWPHSWQRLVFHLRVFVVGHFDCLRSGKPPSCPPRIKRQLGKPKHPYE